MKELEILFYKAAIHDVLRSHEKKLYVEIANIGAEQLLNTNVEDWCDYFEQNYTLEVPTLPRNPPKF